MFDKWQMTGYSKLIKLGRLAADTANFAKQKQDNEIPN